MKIWKRNAVAVTVFLFVCAGIYLNWYYTKQADTPALEQTLNSEQVMGEDTLVFSSDGDSAPAEAAKQTAAEAEHSADSFATIRLSICASLREVCTMSSSSFDVVVAESSPSAYAMVSCRVSMAASRAP